MASSRSNVAMIAKSGAGRAEGEQTLTLDEINDRLRPFRKAGVEFENVERVLEVLEMMYKARQKNQVNQATKREMFAEQLKSDPELAKKYANVLKRKKEKMSSNEK